jgi:(hydroxyamino)benzene mutase
MPIHPLQQRVAKLAVVLLAIAMVTGGWAGVALSGKVSIPIPRLALAAHLNALLGGFWLLAFSFTLPMLSYSDKAKERLAWLQIIPNYGNWFVTLIASFLGVRGLAFTGDVANDIIAGALITIVVMPALVGTFAWAWGFRERAAASDSM